MLPPPFGGATYYVLYVDTTLGADFPDAIVISGGCGSAVINNIINAKEVFPLNPVFTQSPDPACVGDTVIITQVGNSFNNSWNAITGLFINTFISPEQVEVVITSDPASVEYIGFDQNTFCPLDFGYNVNINANCDAPTAGFMATANPICPGTCAGFSNLSINATSYQWSFAGATPNSSTAANPTNICYNTPGSYDVLLIATNSLGSDTLDTPNYITVLPYPPPQSIVQSGDTLIANAGFSSYQWYYNSVLISGATNSFYLATQNGDYNIISDDANGCEVEAAVFNVVTEIQSAVGNGQLSIYPNPVNDKCAIRNLEFTIEAAVSIKINNVLGENVLVTQSVIKNQKSEMSVDVSSLPSGIYYLEVTDRGKIFHAKFVKE